VQKSTVICAITEDVNLSWEGWQHYRKIEGNAGGVFEENRAGVLSAGGVCDGNKVNSWSSIRITGLARL